MGLIALLSIPIAGLTWLTRATGSAREAACAAQCQGNLRQISVALQIYESSWGTLPPAYTTDATGRPLLSWRVLILPYQDQQALYARFRLDEPWDGPNNIRLLGEMPMLYACPTHQPRVSWIAPGRFTNYLAMTGPGTAFPGPDAVSFARISDGRGATLLIAESNQADVPWTAPIDVDAGTGALSGFKFPASIPRGPTTPHPSGLSVLMADGGVYRLDPKRLPRVLRAISTIAGGERTKRDDLRPKPK